MLVKVWSVERVTELHRLQKFNEKLYTGEKDNSIYSMKITKTNHRTRQNKSIVALIGKPELEAWDLYKVQAPPRSV